VTSCAKLPVSLLTDSASVSSSSSLTTQENLLYNQKLYLLIFLTVLKKGTHSLNTLKIQNTSKILSSIIKYCIERVESKTRNDFSLHMEHYKEEYKSSFFDKYKNIYDKYYESFILRIQIVNILAYLTKKNDISNIERGKGYNIEEDKRIINWVLMYGYDNFPSSTGREKGAFRGKSADDLNQRIRKIVLNLNKGGEEKKEENDSLVKECVMVFGRIVDENRECVRVWYENKIKGNDEARYYEDFEGEVEEFIKGFTKGFEGKKKRGVSFVVYSSRVSLFDSLRGIEEVPVLKRSSGLPRKWNVENDQELRDTVVMEGLSEESCGKVGVSLEVGLKRLEMIIDRKGEVV